MTAYLHALLGGVLLGLSVVLLLLVNGRIAGISGILGGLLGGRELWFNAAFVIGLLSGPIFYAAAYNGGASLTIVASWPTVVISGLLVGVGTRLGSGCTSGHGILGFARFSKRSMVATATFLAMGVISATTTGALK